MIFAYTVLYSVSMVLLAYAAARIGRTEWTDVSTACMALCGLWSSYVLVVVWLRVVV